MARKFQVGKVYQEKAEKNPTCFILMVSYVENFFNKETLKTFPGPTIKGNYGVFIGLEKHSQDLYEYGNYGPAEIKEFVETPLEKAREVFSDYQQLFTYGKKNG